LDTGGPPLTDSYGGVSLHERSHGESFLALANHRFSADGLYLLDEPEAALSPQGLLALMRRMADSAPSARDSSSPRTRRSSWPIRARRSTSARRRASPRWPSTTSTTYGSRARSWTIRSASCTTCSTTSPLAVQQGVDQLALPLALDVLV